MKFTVLGASGFVGRHLIASLRRDGHEVFSPAKYSTEIFEQPLGHVLYCIGLTADFRSRPYDTVRAHVSVLTEILEKADFESLLYLSSTRVYGRSISGKEDAPISVDPSDPSDLYNISKLAGEALCRSCGRTNVRVVRISNIIGHDPSSENFLFALMREARTGRITLQSDPASAKDYILIEDVVALLPKIGVSGREWLYNVASGVNLSHREIVDRLVALTGCEVTVLPSAPLIKFPLIDIGRIRREFGYSPCDVLNIVNTLAGRPVH